MRIPRAQKAGKNGPVGDLEYSNWVLGCVYMGHYSMLLLVFATTIFQWPYLGCLGSVSRTVASRIGGPC